MFSKKCFKLFTSYVKRRVKNDQNCQWFYSKKKKKKIENKMTTSVETQISKIYLDK